MRIALLLLVLPFVACGVSPTMSEAEALARARTIADLSGWQVFWVDDDNLARLGHPELVGLTNLQAKIIYAAEGDPSIVIHEAIHVKTEEGGHCDWSNRFLDIHNRLEVRGAFTDECDGVRCSSDGTGHNWSCR